MLVLSCINKYEHNDLPKAGGRIVGYCYGEICNHHRNSLNKGPCHRSPDRKTRRDTLDRTREELHVLSVNITINFFFIYSNL